MTKENKGRCPTLPPLVAPSPKSNEHFVYYNLLRSAYGQAKSSERSNDWEKLELLLEERRQVNYEELYKKTQEWLEANSGSSFGDQMTEANSSPRDLQLPVETSVSQPALPPASAEFLLQIFADTAHKEAIIGDAEERFRRNCERRGITRATCLYWAEVIRSAAPLLWQAIRNFGIVGTIAGAVLRYFR